MNNEKPNVENERALLNDAREKGTGATLFAFAKLSGPGWLQSAITLGGGSLAGGLYLGVLSGYSMMWLQPLAMILGVIMLSAIGYVALSTGKGPFRAIKEEVNPVLAWGWAIATLMANLVWCLPQFALGTAAIQQNLVPGIPKVACVAILFIAAGTVIWFYDSGGKGIKIFETLLKIMVAIVVLCFFGVVIRMTFSSEGLEWGKILAGFIPNPSLLFKPAAGFVDVLAQAGDYSQFWTDKILSQQRDVMVTAAATAVGINMTFLLPYSLLARGWDRDFRGLATFDLSTGLFIPFVLATSCVVIASASQFHAKYDPGLLGEPGPNGEQVEPAANLVGAYTGNCDARLKAEHGEAFDSMTDDQKAAARAALPLADRQLAAMLVKRDAFNLAASLERLTGKTFSHVIFGIGVLGMAISTIIILMLINGFVVCEMLGLPSHGTPHRIGCFLAGITGATGPFLWAGKAKFWLAVPTSVFGMILLPIAYWTFFAIMNNKRLLGDAMPQGGKRIAANIAMFVAAGLATFGAGWVLVGKPPAIRTFAFTLVGIFVVLAVIAQVMMNKKHAAADNDG
jgi:Mn2+/Fe2+ NRAMP family transporter